MKNPKLSVHALKIKFYIAHASFIKELISERKQWIPRREFSLYPFAFDTSDFLLLLTNSNDLTHLAAVNDIRLLFLNIVFLNIMIMGKINVLKVIFYKI